MSVKTYLTAIYCNAQPLYMYHSSQLYKDELRCASALVVLNVAQFQECLSASLLVRFVVQARGIDIERIKP